MVGADSNVAPVEGAFGVTIHRSGDEMTGDKQVTCKTEPACTASGTPSVPDFSSELDFLIQSWPQFPEAVRSSLSPQALHFSNAIHAACNLDRKPLFHVTIRKANPLLVPGEHDVSNLWTAVCLIQGTSAGRVIPANDSSSRPISRSLLSWPRRNVKGYFPEIQDTHHERRRPRHA